MILLLKGTGLEGCYLQEPGSPVLYMNAFSQFKTKWYILVRLHVSLVPA